MNYRLNIKNCHIAECTADDGTTLTYGTIKAIPGMMSIALKPKLSEGELYGDGEIVASDSKLTSIEVDIDMTKIPLDIRGLLSGATVSEGVLEEKSTDVAPYIALGFEIENDDGKSEFVWLLKGKASPLEDSVKQKEGSISYSTHTMKLKFIPRKKDKMIRKFADESASGFVASTGTGWFTTVPVPA